MRAALMRTAWRRSGLGGGLLGLLGAMAACNPIFGIESGELRPEGEGGASGSSTSTTAPPSASSSSGGGGASSTTEAGPGPGGTGGGDVCPEGLAACDEDAICDDDVVESTVHCGGCDHACSPCTDGRCAEDELAAEQANPTAIVVAGDVVAWSNETTTVWALTLPEGDPEPLAEAEAIVAGLATDGAHVYWGQLDGVIARTPPEGGEVVLVATEAGSPIELVVTADRVVFADFAQQRIGWVPKEGGGTPTWLAVDQADPRGVAVDGTHVYWTNQGDGRVQRVPQGGGEAERFADGEAAPLGIAVDATHVYWVNRTNGQVRRAALAGGEPETLRQAAPGARKLVLDGGRLHWTTFDGTQVLRVDVDGSNLLVLAVGEQPLGLALDPTHAFFTDYEAGRIVRVPR